MYAVISERAIQYLGSNDNNEALAILEANPGASMVNVNTLTELASLFAAHAANFDSKQENPFSKATERVLEILDEIGVNEHSVEEVVQTLKERGQTAVTEVKHLGIKSMRTVGEGFVALGDLLRKQAGESPDETE